MNKNIYVYLLFFLVLLLLILPFFDFDRDASVDELIPKIQLQTNGYCVGSQLFTPNEISSMHTSMKKRQYKALQDAIQSRPKLNQFINKQI